MPPSLFRKFFTVYLALLLTACSATSASSVPSALTELPTATQPQKPTLFPIASPTPISAPTRIPHTLPTSQPMVWQVPVIQFNWDSIFGLEYASWVSDRTFSFYTSSGEIHQVSLNDNGNLTLDDTQNVNQARSYSPHRQYIAECSASDISLYRLPERHLVGSASMAVPEAIDFLNCDQSIQ